MRSASNSLFDHFLSLSRLHQRFPKRGWITWLQQLQTFDHQYTLKQHQLQHSIPQLPNMCLPCSPLPQQCVQLLRILLQTCPIQQRNGKRRNLLPNSELMQLPTYRILQRRLVFPTILQMQLLPFITESIQISRHQSVSTSSWI